MQQPQQQPQQQQQQQQQQRSNKRTTAPDKAAGPKSSFDSDLTKKPSLPLLQAEPALPVGTNERTVPARTNERPIPVASAVSPSVVPEEHADGDAVETFIRKLKGTRPDLLRTANYYEGFKHVYGIVAGLPILSSLAPTVESVTESFINMTPLKPSPEEQAEQKSVSVLDKKISKALSHVDEMLDAKKDETIEGIVSAKKAVGNLGPVKGAVGVACSVGDGVGKAYGSANNTVGGAWQQAWNMAMNTYNGVTTMAGDTVNRVTNTVGCTVNQVKATTGKAVGSAKSTAGNTVDGVKSMVGRTTNSIGSTWNWAASNTVGMIKTVVSYPINVLHSIMRRGQKKTTGPPPEE